MHASASAPGLRFTRICDLLIIAFFISYVFNAPFFAGVSPCFFRSGKLRILRTNWIVGLGKQFQQQCYASDLHLVTQTDSNLVSGFERTQMICPRAFALLTLQQTTRQ